ncbi:hypothetical protein D3C76_788250 [compost metagenome]
MARRRAWGPLSRPPSRSSPEASSASSTISSPMPPMRPSASLASAVKPQTRANRPSRPTGTVSQGGMPASSSRRSTRSGGTLSRRRKGMKASSRVMKKATARPRAKGRQEGGGRSAGSRSPSSCSVSHCMALPATRPIRAPIRVREARSVPISCQRVRRDAPSVLSSATMLVCRSAKWRTAMPMASAPSNTPASDARRKKRSALARVLPTWEP